MLIGFIGSPCSGKTTTAAMTFADMKNMGISSEYIPEQARMLIAEKRLFLGLPVGAPVQLDDEDQFEIVSRQMESEWIMLESSAPGTVVITDTAALCTLLYMSEQAREQCRSDLEVHIPRYDLLFYCPPVKMPRSLDSNRIHSEEQALALDRSIPEILRQFAPELKPILLFGDSKERHHVVTRTILEELTR